MTQDKTTVEGKISVCHTASQSNQDFFDRELVSAVQVVTIVVVAVSSIK